MSVLSSEDNISGSAEPVSGKAPGTVRRDTRSEEVTSSLELLVLGAMVGLDGDLSLYFWRCLRRADILRGRLPGKSCEPKNARRLSRVVNAVG